MSVSLFSQLFTKFDSACRPNFSVPTSTTPDNPHCCYAMMSEWQNCWKTWDVMAGKSRPAVAWIGLGAGTQWESWCIHCSMAKIENSSIFLLDKTLHKGWDEISLKEMKFYLSVYMWRSSSNNQRLMAFNVICDAGKLHVFADNIKAAFSSLGGACVLVLKKEKTQATSSGP